MEGNKVAGDKKPVVTWKIWTQRRHVLTFFVFCGYFNIYLLRTNMSIGIVIMTQNQYTTLDNGTSVNIGPEFDWDNIIQGYILSSFFYGYITTQLLGGLLGKKFGGKLIFGGGIGATALITLISPWLAELNVYALILARILMGVFEGVTYSSLYVLWVKWVPPSERSRSTTQAMSGSYLGAVFALMFFAYLGEVAGWRSIFWFSGSIGLLWFAAWMYVTSECPQTDHKISTKELEYIQDSLRVSQPSKAQKVQWKHLFTSWPVWSLNVAMFCETWGFYTLLTLLPKYFKDVFQLDISKSGIFSALPYISISVMMHVCGQLADLIIGKKWLTITKTRKTFMCIGFFSQTCFMLGAAFWGQAAGTVFCLAMAVGLGAFAIATVGVNALDIAPLHSSLVFGIANTWGTVPGIMSPIIAGYVISTDNPTVEQWRIIFYITAGLYFFGAIFFVVFASGRRQHWDLDAKSVQAAHKVLHGEESKEITTTQQT